MTEIAHLLESPAEQIAATVDAAARAAASWAKTSRTDRANSLRAVADAMNRSADDLIPIVDSETALGATRLTGELARTVHQLRMFADVVEEGTYLEVAIDHANLDAPVPISGDIRRWLVPIGPVAVFSASNFPLAFSVLGGDTASALAAGCTVVVKAHQGHPRTSDMVLGIARNALRASGITEDIIGLVHGREAGRSLISHPAIAAAGFTGSVAGGKALAELAHARTHPIPFFGELGSQNTFLVSSGAADARADAIADGLANSVLLGNGQFCTKPGLVFLPASPSGQRIVDVLADRIGSRPESAFLTGPVRDGFVAGIGRLLDATGLTRLAGSDTATAPSLWECEPALLGDEVLEECFGPTAVVVRYRDQHELSGLLDRVDPALTATFHTEQHERDFTTWILDTIAPKAGRIVANQYPTGVAVTASMHHGGPSPSTTNSQHTSVGATSIRRFLRPIAFQNVEQELLPAELRDMDGAAVLRRIDGTLSFNSRTSTGIVSSVYPNLPQLPRETP
ncbi:aldehyde dehydrogenase [Rhodococcoides trifolii]|uniref:Aldehyde dehydrogenase n=1 Tax=Rhodococcoides trifolii TaxID=908250 RepID=A0A917G875_9NOCA|nr:aldehyde dehydrogenase family protein [Rhodococcus trifolii]GGG27302.1 aldehyde dehydrogenase [Rhodococcus trifolii]